MKQRIQKSKLFMDTVVHIDVFTEMAEGEAEARIDRAFNAFRMVEQTCSRFTPDSELMRACKVVGVPVPVSPYVYEPLKFALAFAEQTGGLFDPAIGGTMEKLGFNRHYLSGKLIDSPSADSVSYRDVVLDDQERTLRLRKPLVIDLGAVAKGFAIDLAAGELKPFERFAVNAGGDLFAGGSDDLRNVWKIGIRHPHHEDRIVETVEVSNEAVCTSGSYERVSPVRKGVHHIVDPRTGTSAGDWTSCSVIAPYAMMADAFSTAAFLLGTGEGEAFLERAGLKGVLVTPELTVMKIGGI
ncbi:FAD:protein FMN transferase [Cohnella candidum]|uniref:FAD:protein FMN transferase n=1 Tax=Cohnella candidum TaxID=2674991 RepID=A0A3G3JSH6_9BACL|nr:FAD:protein FMN transferase [Cohnella candidum]AYQ71163.1 FAD:protein FMN transferase [Cohnella candidum]